LSRPAGGGSFSNTAGKPAAASRREPLRPLVFCSTEEIKKKQGEKKAQAMSAIADQTGASALRCRCAHTPGRVVCVVVPIWAHANSHGTETHRPLIAAPLFPVGLLPRQWRDGGLRRLRRPDERLGSAVVVSG